MPSSVRRWILSLCLVLPALAHATPPQYQVVPITATLVTRLALASDLVVGTRLVEGQPHAFLLHPTETDLGLLPGGTVSIPLAVREGFVAGQGSTGTGAQATHAWRWSAPTGMVDCGTLGGPELTAIGAALSARGVLGYGDNATQSALVAMRWDGCGTPQELPSLGGIISFLVASNDAGDGIGHSQTSTGVTHAALWLSTGGVIDQHTLPDGQSFGADVNVHRETVGDLNLPTGQQGFRNRGDGVGMVILEPLAGDTQAQVRALNDAGDSVGRSYLPAPRFGPHVHQEAVLWESDTTSPVALVTRLVDATGWQLDDALGINNAGMILGMGRHDGVPVGFLLIPVQTAVPPPPSHPRPPRRRQER